MSSSPINFFERFDKGHFRKGAPESAIQEAERSSGLKFPEEYVAFLRKTDGYEGEMGKGFARLWACSELLQSNKDYEIESLAPGYFAIGSDGGGESFGFKIESGEFFMVAFISSGWSDAIPIGDSFGEFIERLNNGTLFERSGNG